MSRILRILACLAAGAVSAGAAGCGDDDTGEPIPAGKASRLEERLDDVQFAYDGGNCDRVDGRIAAAERTVESLDEDGVGSDVQDALADGVANLRSLASDCVEEEEPVETTPETVPTTPPPPETETEETETEEPPPPEPEPEEDEDGDGGNGEDGAEGEFDSEGGGIAPPGQVKKEGSG